MAESSGGWQVKDVEVQINTADRNFSCIPSVNSTRWTHLTRLVYLPFLAPVNKYVM